MVNNTQKHIFLIARALPMDTLFVWQRKLDEQNNTSAWPSDSKWALCQIWPTQTWPPLQSVCSTFSWTNKPSMWMFQSRRLQIWVQEPNDEMCEPAKYWNESTSVGLDDWGIHL